MHFPITNLYSVLRLDLKCEYQDLQKRLVHSPSFEPLISYPHINLNQNCYPYSLAITYFNVRQFLKIKKFALEEFEYE